MQRLFITILCVLTIFTTRCNRTNSSESQEGQLSTLISQPSDNFPYDLLNQYASSQYNVVLSPTSIQAALLMLAFSTEGNTRTEILKTLGLKNLDNTILKKNIQLLLQQLNVEDSTFSINFQNAVFYDASKIHPRNDFLKMMKELFRAEIGSLDFSESTAIDKINAWAEDATNGKIEKVLSKIKDEEVLFFLNALYLKADWNMAFNKKESFRGVFFTSENGNVPATFMQKRTSAETYLNEQVQVVQLPLGSSRFSATFFMPLEQDLSTFIKTFNKDTFNYYLGKLNPQFIDLKFPLLEIKYHTDMSKALKSLGIHKAFSAGGDFNPIARNSSKIYVSRVLHDTYFKMDEGGIEGAAVTTVGVGITSLPTRVIYDHPFLICMKDNETGKLLFLVIVRTPTTQK